MIRVTKCDVAILGGGPAGLATALSLLQHDRALTVTVLERGGYDEPRIGETLPPNARPLLQQLGVWAAFVDDDHLPAHGTCATWGEATLHENEFLFGTHGHGWHLDRRAFDAMLAQEAVRRGATVYTRSRILDCGREGDRRWQLTTRSGEDSPRRLQARFVVDATGRVGWFARRQGAQRVAYDRLTAAAVLLEVDPARVGTYALVEACELGWWYSALLPAGRLIVMCLSDADLVRLRQLKTPAAWLAEASRAWHTRERLQAARPLDRPATYSARTERLRPVIGAAWLAVGDAASTFDPLSSQGISKALRSGIFASYAVLDRFEGRTGGLERYAALHDREFEQYLATWAEYYAREQRWPRAPFWRRRHSVPPVTTRKQSAAGLHVDAGNASVTPSSRESRRSQSPGKGEGVRS